MSALLVGLFLLIVFAPDNVWAGVIVLLIAFVLGESILRAVVRAHGEPRRGRARARRGPASSPSTSGRSALLASC